MAEVLTNGGKIYLAAGVALGLLMQPLSPGDPEQQLAHHLAAVERLLEGVPAGDRAEAAAEVDRYMLRFGSSVARIKEQLGRYDTERSIAAYRKIEKRLGPLLAAARSQASPELYRTLLQLIP